MTGHRVRVQKAAHADPYAQYELGDEGLVLSISGRSVEVMLDSGVVALVQASHLADLGAPVEVPRERRRINIVCTACGGPWRPNHQRRCPKLDRPTS